jgi:predicted dehydrogenase
VGEQVAVIGLGLLGLLAVQIARAAGCSVLGVDLDPKRVDLARKLGATAVLRAEAENAVNGFSRGRGCDLVLICADTHNNDPIQLAGALARDRGRVVAVGAVGLDVPRKVYYEKELDFRVSRSYGPGRYDPGYEEGGRDYPIGFVRWTENRNMEAVVDLLAGGKLDVRPLISHRFAISDAVQAYDLITGKKPEPFLGVLLTYPGSSELELPAGGQRVHIGSTSAETRLGVDDLRLGVLGAGNYASAVFLPAVRRAGGCRREVIASASGITARAAADRFGFASACSSDEQVLADAQVNVVAILTRHNLHARQILSGLRSGKSVFCEKPLAITPEELDEIAEQLQKADTPLLMAGFNRRFAPLSRRLMQFLAGRSEPFVATYRVNAGALPLTHWTQDPLVGGGRIIGEGCHFVDYLTMLAGAAPVAVTAHGLPDGGRYREDNVVLDFEFPDGSLGTLLYLANGEKSFPKERVEVFCGGSAAALDDFRSLELARGGSRSVVRSRLKQDKGHQAGWNAFLAAVRTGSQAPIPYDQLLGVTRATFAAVEALRSGQRVEIKPD